MEDKKQICSSIEHDKIEVISYCQECNVFMHNKCDDFHSKLCQNHHTHNTNKQINEIFTGFCKEKNNFDKLEYFCKTHNILCSAAYISKIKSKGNGQHTDCNVCNIRNKR